MMCVSLYRADDFLWHSQNHHEMLQSRWLPLTLTESPWNVLSTEPMTSSGIHRMIMKCCRADDFLWHSQNDHEMLQSRWLPLTFTESPWNVAEPMTSSDIHRIIMNDAELMTSSDIHRITMKWSLYRADDFLWHSQNHHEMLQSRWLPLTFTESPWNVAEPMTSSDIHRITWMMQRRWLPLTSQNPHEMLQSRWLPLTLTESSWNVAEPMTSSDIRRIIIKCSLYRADDFLWHSQNHEMLLPIRICCITVFHKLSPRSSQQIAGTDTFKFDVNTNSLDRPGFESVWTPLPVMRTRNSKTTHSETLPN